ncbi:MAG: hypothetical protein HQK77_02720 [Desulfobacterales bacterium]|nr:hypothetical protein [Desulfobacterales bacterium]
MKRLSIMIVLLTICLSFSISMAETSTSGIGHEFGGYWRTRGYMMRNFTGESNTGDLDMSLIDTRTRLYYTAVINDNLKLVNKFEMNAYWGDNRADASSSGYGDFGTDGKDFQIKHTYADFNIGCMNAKIGAQGRVLARGFLIDDDFAGAVLTCQTGPLSLPFMWAKIDEGFAGKDANEGDFDYYGFLPELKINDNIQLNPYVLFAYKQASETEIYFLGSDLDMNMGPMSLWLTVIWEGYANDSHAYAYLGAVGGNVDLGMAGIHAQTFYASGQCNSDSDKRAFFVPAGQSYYWGEIMGYGTFDELYSNNSPGDRISNIWATNVGATLKPMAKLSVSFDLWYAVLAEDIMVTDLNDRERGSEDELGLEADLKVTYQLMDNLDLDVVLAYLIAGDATYKGRYEEDPYEIGTQLSLSF